MQDDPGYNELNGDEKYSPIVETSMTKQQRWIRVIASGDKATKGQVRVLTPDGVDLAKYITGMEIEIAAGQMHKLTIHTFVEELDIPIEGMRLIMTPTGKPLQVGDPLPDELRRKLIESLPGADNDNA